MFRLTLARNDGDHVVLAVIICSVTFTAYAAVFRHPLSRRVTVSVCVPDKTGSARYPLLVPPPDTP